MPPEKTTSNQLLKSINQQKVLRLIYMEGPISRVELAEKTGLTQQTITNIVNRLLNEDIVLEMEPVTRGGGRKPVPLVVNGTRMYAIGIEVATKYIRGSLVDFHNNLVKQATEHVPVYKGAEQPLEYICKVIDELMKHLPDPLRLMGIGCSIQGMVDSKQGVVIYSAGLGWRMFPVGERLERKYGLPVYVENDANLLSIVENLRGHLAGSQHNITLKFDYGIGGAIVLNKQLVTGSTHVAGEFGHYKAISGERARSCHCGGKGCLTTVASTSSLKRHGGLTVEELRERVSANEPEAVAMWGEMVDAIGRAVGNLVTIFNPDHLLLTGKLTDTMQSFLLPELRKFIRECVPESCRGVHMIHLPETPDESVTACGLVMNHYFDIPIESLHVYR
ncbi:ROK family transcriptional regulator [Paenibacillus sp. GYB003]|uniref:ROK family transcriptional regulator n=1 Tax=Paenibacillus sp. GYB003 TaxID=2994392 RepID=UPI002F96B316